MTKELIPERGDLLRDRVSGWTGVCTAEYHYLNGCVRMELSGPDKDGKPEGYVFDIQQVEVVEKCKVTPIPLITDPERAVPEPTPTAPLPSRTGGPRGSAPVAR